MKQLSADEMASGRFSLESMPRADALGQAGLDEASWAQAERAWIGALLSAFGRGEVGLSAAYVAAWDRRRARAGAAAEDGPSLAHGPATPPAAPGGPAPVLGPHGTASSAQVAAPPSQGLPRGGGFRPVAEPSGAPLPAAPPSRGLRQPTLMAMPAASPTALPFGTSCSPSFPAELDEAHALATSPAAFAGGTADLTDLLAAGAAALPFLAPRPAAVAASESPPPQAAAARSWTLEHYASFCAELAECPHDPAKVRQRWYLGDDLAYRRVIEFWEAACRSDPPMRARLDSLVASYRHALARAPRP